MSTVNISLPEAMKKFVDSRVADGSYSTVSEYFRELVRLDQERAADKAVEQKLLEAIDSPDAGVWTKKDFADIKADLRRRFGKKGRLMPQIIKADKCIVEFAEIVEYIARDNLDAAIRLVDAFDAALEKLAEMPGMGRAYHTDYPKLKGVRVWVMSGFENYLIYYLPIPGGIRVLHIFHGMRDVRRILEESDE